MQPREQQLQDGGGNGSGGVNGNNTDHDHHLNSGGVGAHGAGAHGGDAGGNHGGLRPTELLTRARDDGTWTQNPENNCNGDTDRQARTQGERQVLEETLQRLPLLLPRPPIHMDGTQQDMDQYRRNRLGSNKGLRSHDRDMEEEMQLSSRNRRY